MKKFLLMMALATTAFGCSQVKDNDAAEDLVYCNPLDLDYGWGIFKQGLPFCRTSADPVIVFFKDRYYLFATHDIGGYRVSDDLMHWENRFFNEEVAEAALNYGSYVAPAVAADENYVYFIKLNRDRSQKTVKIIRTSDPDKGKWEVCGEIKRVSDPTLFIDNGRYYVYHGLGIDQSLKCFELDPETMTEIEGSEKVIKAFPRDIDEYDSGYYFGRREIYDEVDARDWKGRFKWLPCPEGSWIIRNGDRYYLQFAAPGTISIWYCDVVMESDNPTGGFVEQPYNPVSLKAGGFIGSAGHSCVFQDRYGNWWQIATMWVGNSNEFERRLGLFPVTFDSEGRMQVHTLLGDYPMVIPQRKFTPDEQFLKGWWCLSYGKTCTASSSVPGHEPSAASDEDVRTWWSAASASAGEWIMLDLEGIKTINAMQMNFSEQNFTPDTYEEDYTAYRVYASSDGSTWDMILDKSGNTVTNPHDFTVLPEPVEARYVKVECVHSMNGVPFGVRDVRLFGHGDGVLPDAVASTQVTRDASDGRFAMLEWTPVENADGYVVRFGISPDFMNQTIQVKGKDENSLCIHILTKGENYFYRVDTYNENGLTEGHVVTDRK